MTLALGEALESAAAGVNREHVVGALIVACREGDLWGGTSGAPARLLVVASREGEALGASANGGHDVDLWGTSAV